MVQMFADSLFPVIMFVLPVMFIQILSEFKIVLLSIFFLGTLYTSINIVLVSIYLVTTSNWPYLSIKLFKEDF